MAHTPPRLSTRKFARANRRALPKGEEIIWRIVRNSRLGLPFRRQMPIGPYFADFACPSARLIVEIDGPAHDEPEQGEKDKIRQAWLERQGWQVLRFEDQAVIAGPDLVSETIRQALKTNES
jgi:very-short-patch-repair endonuclease